LPSNSQLMQSITGVAITVLVTDLLNINKVKWCYHIVNLPKY